MQIKELTDELKLNAFYEALQEQLQQSAYDELPFEKRLGLLLEAEKTSRDNKRIQRLQSQAKLHEKSAAIEEIHFTPTRGIPKATLLELAGGEYIQSHRNVILTGATGTGYVKLSQM